MEESKRLELVKAYERYLTTKATLARFSEERPFGRSVIAEYYAAVENAHEAWVALVSEFGFPGVDFPVYFHVKHIHNSWACKGIKHNSLNRSREYTTIEATGMTTEQLVETYRENVCTHCFPAAPVAEFRAQAAAAKKQEREQKAVTKAAEQAAKSITMPDGSPLRDLSNLFTIKTLVTAQRELVAAVMTVEFVEKLYPMPNRAFFADHEAFIQRAIEAIVAKTGAETTAVLAEARAKAEKKFKKEYK